MCVCGYIRTNLACNRIGVSFNTSSTMSNANAERLYLSIHVFASFFLYFFFHFYLLLFSRFLYFLSFLYCSAFVVLLHSHEAISKRNVCASTVFMLCHGFMTHIVYIITNVFVPVQKLLYNVFVQVNGFAVEQEKLYVSVGTVQRSMNS